jgi:hypothetical protein
MTFADSGREFMRDAQAFVAAENQRRADVDPVGTRPCGECEDGCVHGTTIPCPHCHGRLVVPVDPVGTDPLVALGRVRSLHGVTHWCFDPDEQPVVYEPDTQWWPCPTLAAAGVSPPAADEAVAEAVREALADGWDEGFEAAVEWQNSYHHANIGPPDPPMNPHDREARGAAPEAEERR